MAINLEQHRGEPNVWDRAVSPARDFERAMLGLVAAGLILGGLRRRTPSGLAMTLAGSALAWAAVSGADQRRLQRARLRAMWPRRAHFVDPVTDASDDSFPASDAPSWTPTTGPVSGQRGH